MQVNNTTIYKHMHHVRCRTSIRALQIQSGPVVHGRSYEASVRIVVNLRMMEVFISFKTLTWVYNLQGELKLQHIIKAKEEFKNLSRSHECRCPVAANEEKTGTASRQPCNETQY